MTRSNGVRPAEWESSIDAGPSFADSSAGWSGAPPESDDAGSSGGSAVTGAMLLVRMCGSVKAARGETGNESVTPSAHPPAEVDVCQV